MNSYPRMFPDENMVDHPTQTEVVLYRCKCKHCDRAQEELVRLCDLYGARFTLKWVERDTYLAGQYAGWTTPMVYVNGQKVSHYSTNVAQWEKAIKEGVVSVPSKIEGEIVDLVCYMDHGAKGSEHIPCAEACVKAGAPIGLLTYTGDTYLLVGDRTASTSYEKLRSLVGDRVVVVGNVFRRGGIQAIVVKNVEYTT
jgi:hypothetical protein